MTLRIVWIASGSTEAEYDIWLSRRPGLDILLACYHPTALPWYSLSSVDNSLRGRQQFLHKLRELHADLYVFRYPFWIDDALMAYVPPNSVAWASEQGPTRNWILRSHDVFKHIGVNNRYEWDIYLKERPQSVLHYLPFGCTHHMAQEPRAEWASDLLADGGPHYACQGDGCSDLSTDKRVSVETMVFPLRDLDLKVWGAGGEDNTHGWMQVPGIRYGGYYGSDQYASVYASCKLYVGITWNWRLGGYGTKLARCLASGVPVIWHRTVGMELDGLVPGEHLETSASPEETREKVRQLLAEPKRRIDLGRAGRQFALRQWEWGNNLLRLAEEIL